MQNFIPVNKKDHNYTQTSMGDKNTGKHHLSGRERGITMYVEAE